MRISARKTRIAVRVAVAATLIGGVAAGTVGTAEAAAPASAVSGYSNSMYGWIAQAQAILAAHGDHVPPADAIAARAMTESSGNPSAENLWDGNAAAGTPSIGLLQVIQPTFDTYALPGYSNIWNPVDNIIAAVRYANARYGAFENIAYGTSGY
ncbi:transglycosylase SLT domain-containing protein [Streptacidiphilus fuscans]|uniref:Transglycosylase SLT domain-containing protein n=1 Tax=Streptacidiphilus fuscans TaxID=2789292 RepID=A0A931B1S5_9ACTN|nr:transglycosylase SLT domain-containing protein [Streptacidiphilus fuscans]MBF9069610.1 transglycosylase SLT domain-containing protein [Streptacidiphilus fuscans]